MGKTYGLEKYNSLFSAETYLKQINQFPLLTPKEEFKLAADTGNTIPGSGREIGYIKLKVRCQGGPGIQDLRDQALGPHPGRQHRVDDGTKRKVWEDVLRVSKK